MSEFAINVAKYVSPLEVIRSAMGDLGYGSLMQTLEPDLIRWTIEAQDLISKAKTLKWGDEDFYTADNKIKLPKDLQMIECVSRNGVPLTYDPTRSCGDCCTANCLSLYTYPANCCEQKYTVDGCYAHFSPTINDDIAIRVKYLVRPMGADGYPLVNSLCLIAIQEYLKWKICFRYRDNRAKECEQRWYYLTRTARAELQKYSQQQLQDLGLMWYAPRVHLNGFYGVSGNYNYPL